tara:strand:- start:555 stop:2171 length:1617 start_codon:yes stop_codon:yes gene_type:complete
MLFAIKIANIMKVLLICKEMIAYERTAIMVLGSKLKEDGHEVRAAVLKQSPTKKKKKKFKLKFLLNSEAYASESSDEILKENSLEEKINNNKMKFQEALDKARDFKPDVVGYSVMTGEHYEILEFNKMLKDEMNFVSVMGGPHPTFNKEIIEEDGIDAICTGEGDTAFSEFVNKLRDKEQYWMTKSFHVKHEGEIYRNGLGQLVDDLNDLPFPDRSVLYDADPNLSKVGLKSFIAGRGCPYKCSYCFNKQYNENYKGLGQIIRARSPEKVIQEIEGVMKNYNLDIVNMNDDVFMLKPNGWLKEFSILYKERINLPFSCNVRASSVKEEDIKSLAEAGMTHVWMGVESGDEDAANKIFLRNTTNETIIKVNNQFLKYGVKVNTFNIMGLPLEKAFETDLKTLDLNIKLKSNFASFGLLYPFPGTAIEKMAVAKGFFKVDKDTMYLESNKNKSMLTFRTALEGRKVENLQKLAGIVVDLPFLRPLMPFVCKLPFTRFYHFLFYIHLGYGHKIKSSPLNLKKFLKELPIFFGYFKTLVFKS